MLLRLDRPHSHFTLLRDPRSCGHDIVIAIEMTLLSQIQEATESTIIYKRAGHVIINLVGTIELHSDAIHIN